MQIEQYNQLKEYSVDVARQMDIVLSKVELIDGREVGCVDTHLLNLISQGQLVSVMIYQSDIENIQKAKINCDMLDIRFRYALMRLQRMTESNEEGL